jgi:hypothetical protein
MNGLSNTELPTKLPLLDVQMSVYMLRDFTLAHVELSFPRSSQPNLNISRSSLLDSRLNRSTDNNGFCSRLFLLHNLEISVKVRV